MTNLCYILVPGHVENPHLVGKFECSQIQSCRFILSGQGGSQLAMSLSIQELSTFEQSFTMQIFAVGQHINGFLHWSECWHFSHIERLSSFVQFELKFLKTGLLLLFQLFHFFLLFPTFSRSNKKLMRILLINSNL